MCWTNALLAVVEPAVESAIGLNVVYLDEPPRALHERPHAMTVNIKRLQSA
jgi:hypothetical protein